MSLEDRVRAEWADHIRAEYPGLLRRAETLAVINRLGRGAGEDLLAEACAILQMEWQKVAVITESDGRNAYLYKVMANVAKRRVVAAAKATHVPLPSDELLPHELELSCELVQNLVKADLFEALRSACDELPDDERMVIALKLTETAHSHREIAAQLGISEKQVSRLYLSAKRRIADRLHALSYDAADVTGGTR